MIGLLRKNFPFLILKPIPTNVRESPIYFSLCLNNFCTSSESEPCINHKLSNILVHNHNFDPAFVSRVATNLSRVRNPENAGLILSFLRESGFPDYRLERIVKWNPHLLSANLENGIKPKIKFLQEMGISSDGICTMIWGYPQMLMMSLNDNIIPSVALLERLLGSKDAVAGVSRRAPRLLLSNLENTVLPKVEFFKGLGVPLQQIRMIMISHPTTFLHKLEVLKKSAETAKEMGVDAGSKTFIYAVTTIANRGNEGWKFKLQSLETLGFSESDILVMFREAPSVFIVSVEKIRKTIELLLGTNKYTMSSIVDYPVSLQFSMEKRYMPRLKILGVLESRNLIKQWPPLWKLALLTDDKFSKEFVIPYSDKVGDVCSFDNSAEAKEDETL